MKRFVNKFIVAAMILFSSLAYAKAGLFFNVVESGAPASADLVFCLNGKGALSCQKYHVSAQDLQISAATGGSYPAAGIQLLTEGYKITGCTPYSNGYCLFAVSPQTPTSLRLDSTMPPSYHKVSGTISGLVGSLSLQNNGGDTLVQNSDGSFTFATAVAEGSGYNVTVLSQPAMQTCTVSNGTGIMGGSNIIHVQITCSTNRYTVGGTITGLVGSVSLQNNGGDTLVQNSDGSFTFAAAVAEGSGYNVTVLSQPAMQTCTVSNGTGIMGGSNIIHVQITCSTNRYTVGGTITGLVGSVSLQNNGGDTLVQNSDGSFTFAAAVAEGSGYNVTVSSQPVAQTCTVINGSGIMGGSNISNVQITCATNSYMVGGSISGLVGSVSLQNNGIDAITYNSDGSFTFATAVAEGSTYNVTVLSQPATQTCTVSNGTGTMGGKNITDVQVTCSINSYGVGGTITGLVGSVSLQNNGGDTLTRNNDGSFTFTSTVAQGSAYNVTISSQPATQTCSVSNGAGTMGSSHITDVQVTCSTNSYTLGGTITGLVGSVSLRNNGGDTLTRNSDGSFSFTTAVAQGSGYNVTVSSQPAAQTCTVNNGTGTMGGSNITNVDVSCVTNTTTLFVFSGAIPVGSSSLSILVINTGTTYAASNVSIALPSGWTGVTQDASNCTSIAPNNGSCNIILTSVTPYVAQRNISVIGDNISNNPVMGLAFSVQGYLVWEVTDATTVQVVDTVDLTTGQWGSNTVITTAQDSRDGFGNTNTIRNTGGIGTSAAASCYNSTNGGVPAGTWYLPAICQMGSAGQAYGCPAGLANINTNLALLQFGNLSGDYWSSTEHAGSPQNNAWYQYYAGGTSGFQASVGKGVDFNIRCARSLTY
ncbi:hypothetical protein [uncultured Legionella sp.]|mgnify:CR=1 FL=1|uniref:hypothetical protein n=1 Tax=uncultured Legionella sp. TaxID=210934 RepID=UPI00262CE209|nr:hypothetical protein [uncultured Legionella sp.]